MTPPALAIPMEGGPPLFPQKTTSDLKKVYVGISSMFVDARRSLKTQPACGTNNMLLHQKEINPMIRITFIAMINAAVNAEINLEDKVHAWSIFLTLTFILRPLTKLPISLTR
jgi:hypothetical protein